MTRDSVTDKKTTFSNKRSKALGSTREAWKPNLRKVRILVDDEPKCVWISAETLRSGKITHV